MKSPRKQTYNDSNTNNFSQIKLRTKTYTKQILMDFLYMLLQVLIPFTQIGVFDELQHLV